MAERAVELIEVSKRYGSTEALCKVSFSINKGESVAILGPNGAGKTTSISLMLGMRKPTIGQVQLFGLPPTDRRARSHCGVMLQESGVSDVLKVGEVIQLFTTYYPRPMSVERALKMAGLDSVAGARVGTLSGGQRQRLYYALAVCGDPDALFLDEPTVGMDVESRHAFLRGIQDFGRHGRTLILTTHYLEEADQLANRIIVIDRGQVVADDSPEKIKAKVGDKKVSFTAQPALEEADFAQLPVRNLNLEGSRVRLLSSQPEEVLAYFFNRGVEVCQLEVVGADLEEAFLNLTQPQMKESVE